MEPPDTQGFLVSVVMALAPVHIPELLVTLVTVQVEMSWSKAAAPLNMSFMLRTAVVFHLLPSVGMALLNFAAFLNMDPIWVTAFVSQSLMSWLKTAVFENMLLMVVTAPVSQLVMSALKA